MVIFVYFAVIALAFFLLIVLPAAAADDRAPGLLLAS